MKNISWIILMIVNTVIFASCKKETGNSLDYNVITEQRILEISEKTSITDEDIATLERLLSNVTDNSLRSKYTEMINGIKLLKDFIPAFQTLRTDPDINFQLMYSDLEKSLAQITDQLPRKAKLQIELETARANYNTEEYEFPESIITYSEIRAFLIDNYNIHEVEGKPNRYLRADIERVDSLSIVESTFTKVGEITNAIKRFKGLKSLRVRTVLEEVLDFNQMPLLEKLDIENGFKNWQLKIDELPNLKSLKIGGLASNTSPFGEVLDFTDKHPFLENLELSGSIVTNLTTLLLPNKPNLKTVQLNSSMGVISLPKIKRLVIEATALQGQINLYLGSDSHLEIDEVRLSGFGRADNVAFSPWPEDVLSINAATTPGKFIHIKTLSLSNLNMQGFGFGGLALNQPFDLGQMPYLISLNFFAPYTINGKRSFLTDFVNIDKLYNRLIMIDIQNLDLPNGILDISKFTTLNGGFAGTNNSIQEPLKKIIMTRALREKVDNGDGTCDGCGFYFDESSVTVELVD